MPLACCREFTVDSDYRAHKQGQDDEGERRLSCLIAMAIVAVLVETPRAAAEWVLIPATDMTGIESWKEGQSWGAGNFWITDESPVSTVVTLEGGQYAVCARIFTPPSRTPTSTSE